MRRHSIGSLGLALLTAVLLAGCPYGSALTRGDEYARKRMWSEAVAAYRGAITIDPDKPEAQVKLREAQRAWARELCERGRVQARTGDLDGAMRSFGFAARVDPESVAARAALAAVLDERAAQAEAALAAGRPDAALAVFDALLRQAPAYPRARAGHLRARLALARQLLERGRAFEARGRVGNALVDYARVVEVWPPGTDAATLGAAGAVADEVVGEALRRAAAVRSTLRKGLTFLVVTRPFDNRTPARDLGARVGPDALALALDTQLGLLVAPSAPAGRHGVRLQASLDRYQYGVERRVRQASLRYQAGTRRVDNPRRLALERQVASRERDVARQEQEEGRYANEEDRARALVDRRATALDRCLERPSSSSSPCSSERSWLNSARRDVERARERRGSARRRLLDERRRLADTKQEMYREPTTIAEPVYETFFYDVHVHRATARLALTYRLTDLFDGRAIGTIPAVVQVVAEDETHAAYPRFRIRRRALHLPAEATLRLQLAGRAVADLRGRIMARYDRYRTALRTDAARLAQAGQDEAAIELYVRALLASPDRAVPGAAAYLLRRRGLTNVGAVGGQAPPPPRRAAPPPPLTGPRAAPAEPGAVPAEPTGLDDPDDE